jgi:hypothetical protein
MATSFNAEYEKALGERCLALVSKRTAIQMRKKANARKEDLERILFGDGQNYGIVHIISILYNQIWIISGKKTSKPALHDFNQAMIQYQVEFALSVTAAGDGAGGLHPPQPDNPEAGQEEINENSVWLTDHALENTPSGTGIVQLIQNFISVIGNPAAVNGNARGPYASQVLAQTQAAADKGAGLLGLRTENSEVYSSGLNQWYIGQNGIDTPDNYTTKTTLLNGLSAIKTGLANLLNCLCQELDILNGADAGILQEFHVDLPDDLSRLQSFIPQIEGFINQVQSYSDYFGQYGDPSLASARDDINNKLNEVDGYMNSILLALGNRVAEIPAVMGNSTLGVNKHLTFWVGDIVSKPDGPYAMLLSAQDMLAQAEASLREKDSRLAFFTEDYTKWLETPVINSIYNRAVLDLDQQTVLRWETDIIWNLVMAANKYKILSMPFSQISQMSNAPWDDSSGEWITDVLPSAFLRNILTKTPPAETTFFRLAAYDTAQGNMGEFERMDAMDTQSPQSDIISDPIEFTQAGNTASGQSVIQVDAGLGLKERDFLWVNGMIAQVIAVTDDKYALDIDYGAISSVRCLFGCYFVPSSSE